MDKVVVIDDPDAITIVRYKVLRSGLGLEIKGLTRHGRSCYSIVKEELGFRGSRERVWKQLDEWIKQKDLELFGIGPKD